MRKALALLAAAGVGLMVFFTGDLPVSDAAAAWIPLPRRSASGGDQRHRNLAFFKAAYDRLELQLRQQPDSPAADSWRATEASIVGRMREEARFVDDLPPDIAALLASPPGPPPGPPRGPPPWPPAAATAPDGLKQGAADQDPEPAAQAMALEPEPAIPALAAMPAPPAAPEPELVSGLRRVDAGFPDGRDTRPDDGRRPPPDASERRMADCLASNAAQNRQEQGSDLFLPSDPSDWEPAISRSCRLPPLRLIGGQHAEPRRPNVPEVTER